jgi:hypothetical protein
MHLHRPSFQESPSPASAGLFIPTGQPWRAGQRRASPCGRASGWCMIPGNAPAERVILIFKAVPHRQSCHSLTNLPAFKNLWWLADGASCRRTIARRSLRDRICNHGNGTLALGAETLALPLRPPHPVIGAPRQLGLDFPEPQRIHFTLSPLTNGAEILSRPMCAEGVL